MTTASRARRGGRRRANGEGRISKVETHAAIRWETKFYGESGHRVKRHFLSDREARAALDEARRRRGRRLEAVLKRHTMGDLFDAWLASLRERVDRGERSLNTWREYESYARQHMRPALGAVDCRRLSVKDVEHNLHDLRHYFVSFLPRLEVHPAVAQKLARHATFGTTMNVYTSVEEGLKTQAVGRLSVAVAGLVGPSIGPRAPENLRKLA